MIDVNLKMTLIADSTLKAELMDNLQQFYKDFGQNITPDEIMYTTTRLFQEINKRYRDMHWGVINKAFESIMVGKVTASKITVHTMLMAIQKQADLWTEVKTRNNKETLEVREKELKNKTIADSQSPIVRASVWLISKRCDLVDVGTIEVKDVVNCIERGINPETLLK